MKKIYNLQFTIYKKGFTLIELLVAIAIIGILSSMLLSNYVGVRQRSRDGVRKHDLGQIQSALEMYRSDKGSYPATNSFPDCNSPLQDASNPLAPVIYMKKIPCDPSSTTSSLINYSYSYDDVSLTYSLVACLENANDPQKESPTSSQCSGTGKTNISYKVQNP